MDPREAELLAKLLPTFRLEADEHLRRIGLLLSELEKELSPEGLEEAFREVHSLKGAARAVGARKLESLCQEMEAVFAGLKKGDLQLERSLLDLLFLAADLAADRAREAEREPSAEMAALLAEATRRLAEAAQGKRVEPPALSPPRAEGTGAGPVRPGIETLRIGTGKIERILVQAEELLTEKVSARHQLGGLRELLGGIEHLRQELMLTSGEGWELQRHRSGEGGPPERGVDKSLRRLAGRLTAAEETAKELEARARLLLRSGGEHNRSLTLKIDSLLETIRETLMLPAATLLEQLPRIVRDLARESGKKVELETVGGEIPVDRRILEELRDPLLQLLRNAIDHGMEGAEERERSGKPERGMIRLEVTSPAPRRILLTLADDGRGMDLEKLKAAAIREGVLTLEETEKLDRWQTAELSFSSGVSTREDITKVSGRGLGLSIARDKVERLGGEVSVFSKAGKGTTFSLEIPAALTSFRGILVRLGASRFVFPAVGVERVLRFPRDRFRFVENRRVLELGGEVFPVVFLQEPLQLPLPTVGGEPVVPLVVTASPQGRVAFAVDEILTEQEFLVKSLGKQLIKVNNFSGAVILGDGGIALLLDPADLVRSASGAAPAPPPAAETPETARRRVLVVEDSITSRTLLRNILEGAGYTVATAVDGVDAMARLASAVFDVVVSDIEMPRMDGFQLTRRIREGFGRLPVVLVTGLESREDRERGMEAGADAYIVKSRFDQGNLLEVLGRLV